MCAFSFECNNKQSHELLDRNRRNFSIQFNWCLTHFDLFEFSLRSSCVSLQSSPAPALPYPPFSVVVNSNSNSNRNSSSNSQKLLESFTLTAVAVAVAVTDMDIHMEDTASFICWCQLAILEAVAGQLHPAVVGNRAVAGMSHQTMDGTVGTKNVFGNLYTYEIQSKMK